MSWLVLVAKIAAAVWLGILLAILGLIGAVFVIDWLRQLASRIRLPGKAIPFRELDPKIRAHLRRLPAWCDQCDMTELVCDVHPRVAFEKCACPDSVPRSCPGCQPYDVTALLEEIAGLRHRATMRGQESGHGGHP